MEVLQTSALPLGDGAGRKNAGRPRDLHYNGNRRYRAGPWEAGQIRTNMERETGFEPATSTLARSHSTTELFPLTRPRLNRSIQHRLHQDADSR